MYKCSNYFLGLVIFLSANSNIMTATRVLARGEVRVSSGRVATLSTENMGIMTTLRQYDINVPLEESAVESKSQQQQQQQQLPTTTQIGNVGQAFEQVYNVDNNSIDTNQLLNACQIFANVMRSTGQTPVARDLEGNMKNIQRLYNENDKMISLDDMLQYEADQGIHKPNGVLQNPSAAIGSLWIRRSLTFQSKFYQGILDGKNPTNAALDAYEQELEPYHGWALRKVYRVGLKTFSPSTKKDALKQIGGFASNTGSDDEAASLEATERDLTHMLRVWRPLLQRWKQVHVELDLEDARKA